MKVGWSERTLGELCEIARGGSPRPIQDFLTDDPTGINWIKISDATASGKYIFRTEQKIRREGISRSRMVKEGDFLLSNSMSFGRPYIMRTTGCIHDGWLVLRDKSGLFDQDFLYHFLASQAAFKQFDSLAAGSTVRNLNIDLAKKVKVLLPPLPEQRRIVPILDVASAGLEAMRANAERNLQNARELFAARLNAVFAEHYESESSVSLSELATDITDGDHMPPPKAESGIPFITISNVDKVSRKIDFADTFLVPPDYHSGLKPNRRPKKGDVLYTVTGSFGIPILIEDDTEFCFQRHIGLIRPKPSIDSAWLNYLLFSSHIFKQAEAGATGTAQKTVSLKVLRNFVVPFPSIQRQKAAVASLDKLTVETSRLAELYRQKLAAIDELKQSILQKAFSGELTSSEAVAA